MTVLKATRGAQYPLLAEFVFNATDTMTDVNGAAGDFATVAAHVFDAIKLPPNAVVIGGEVVTETAVSGATAYNIKVGDSANDARYLASTDKVAAGRTALVPTGYVGLGENLRITVTPTVAAATAGKVSIRVMYVIRNRVQETQTH